jgi:hypothetical protein
MNPPYRDRAGGASMHLRLSLFFLKSAPGGTLPSADKWAVNTTRPVELLNLTACIMVHDPAGGC